MKIYSLILILCLFLLTSLGASTKNSETLYKQHIEKNIYANNREPITIFTFDELVKLSRQPEPEDYLRQKLDLQLAMPYILNRNFSEELNNSYLRVVQWNIKRGFNTDTIRDILTAPKSYEAKHIVSTRWGKRKHFKDELYTLASADVISLNEVDIGMPRTNYKNIVASLADALSWNYVFSTEFVELGPIIQKEKVDKSKYKGLHGNAIISRFPIVSARAIQLPNYYDWYREEIEENRSPIEYVRKFGAKSVFSERILPYEVRHGSRQAILADIKLPTGQIVTVVSTHLEDRAYPDERLKQFKSLLASIKDVKTPLVLTGDFNTSTTDTRPTSFKKEVYKRIRDPHFFLRQAAFVPIPFVPVAGGVIAVAFSKLLQYKDPFFPSVPIMFPNHERSFLTTLKKFKFSDGYAFDLSGDKKKSSNKRKGLLANSNQRHWKGFKSTYKFEKPRIIAYFKLDWFFIKPVGNHFVPFNGKTLKTLNYSIKGHISDHNPITVDLKL